MANKRQFIKKIAQTCSSRQCRKRFKNDLSEYSNAICTPHEYDRKTKKIKCLFCNKITKI